MESMEKPEERCEVCRFSINHPGAAPGYLLCRRYPPQMLIATTKGTPLIERDLKSGGAAQVVGTQHETQNVVGHFPLMEITGWCGEYRSKDRVLN